MGKGIIDSSILTAIANAIRKILGVDTEYRPDEMAGALDLTETLNITENGTYDVKKYAKVVVNVSGGVDPDPIPPEDCDHSHISYRYNGNGTYNVGGGTHEVFCSDCGAVLDSSESCDYMVTKTTATCEEGGVETLTCRRCGGTYQRDALSLGHNIVWSPLDSLTCQGQCTRCGDYFTRDHNMVNGVCTRCGYTEECSHDAEYLRYINNGDGTHEIYCSNCGVTIALDVPCGSVATACGDDQNHNLECPLCGYVHATEPHTYGMDYVINIEGGEYLVQDCEDCGHQMTVEVL